MRRPWFSKRFTHLLRLVRRPLLPQLVIIGAQKSGTTALATYLGQHPRFVHPLVKEVDYFGSDPRFRHGLRWYASQWPDAADSARHGGKRLTGLGDIRFDASPHYLRASQAAARLRDRLPSVRLIAILRDPVERAYSAWHMYRQQLALDPAFYETWNQRCYHAAEIAAFEQRTPAELDDFELAVKREVACLARGRSMMWSLLEYGLYGPQLRRYYDTFPREQLLILEHRDLKFHRVETLNRVLKFAGLEAWDWSHADLSEVFTSQPTAPMPERARDFLREFYVPSNRLLEGIMDPLPDWAVDSPRASAVA